MLSYMIKVCKGVMNVIVELIFKQVILVVVQVDGQNGFGYFGVYVGMNVVIEFVKVFGIGMVSIKCLNYYGMVVWLVQQVIDVNMMSLVFINLSFVLLVFGGKSKFIGVLLIVCGVFGKDDVFNFIFDMVLLVVVRGKIYKVKCRGEKIFMDWVLDGEGCLMDDLEVVFGGVMFFMGGFKGFVFGLMMDVFLGVFLGLVFVGYVVGFYDFLDCFVDVGYFLMVIKLDLFMSLEEFCEWM